MRSPLLILALVSAALVGAIRPSLAATALPTVPQLRQAIDAALRPMLERGDLSGQLLVTRDGEVIVERAYGMANRELSVPVSGETRFNIASVTKPMTAVLAIQLIDEGRLALSDSIARWLHGFPSGDSITVSHLLRHRSGIRHEVIPDSEMVRPFTAAEVVERARRLPLDFRPGERERYSSGGFEVLARVLELASGTPYDRLLEQRIFATLGMKHSGHVDSRAIVPGRAAGYVPGPHGIENAPLADFSAIVGAGSAWSTARDLQRFVDAIVTGKLGAGPRQSYLRSGRLSFNGRTGGFKAWALHDSASRTTAVFVGNLGSGAPDWIRSNILRLTAGEAVTPPVLPDVRRDVSEAELRRWVGVYQIENGPRLDLHIRQGALYSNDWVMLPTVDGALFSPRDYGIVRGVAGNDGRLARLDWVQGKDTYPAPRVK
jgi:CubicO group peptidase (beta-lactamase class C family)